MVARLFRLRLALALGHFRGSRGRVLRAAALYIACLAGAVIAALGPARVLEPGPARNALDVLLGALVVCVATAAPFFDSRRNLAPRQFSEFPRGAAAIGWSLLLSTAATLPFLVLVTWLGALAAARPEWREAGWIAPLSLALVGLYAMAGVRLASGLSRLIAGERFASALRFFGGVLCVALVPVIVFETASVLRSPDKRELVDTAAPLGWSPFGAGFAAIADASAGDTGRAAIRLALLAGAVLIIAGLWFAVVRVSIRTIDRPRSAANARNGLGWFEHFSAKPAQAIAARQLTYWGRDPRYRIALIALPIAPAAVLLAFLLAGADLRLAAALPLPILMLLLGWSQHNDIAMDSTAIWEHVASGVKGRADRAGRLTPVLLLGIPLAVIGSSVAATAMGDWRVLPALVGANVAVLFIATGVSSVFSALMPYPATRPGDSPFVQPQWAGSGSGTSQTVSMLAAIALATPPLAASTFAVVSVSFIGNLLALAFGVAYGLAILIAGVVIGGRVFDRQGPEILAVTQMFD